MTDLQNISLPKWPQMLVSGKPVTPEQAKAIILRTDHFLTDPCPYAGGNSHEFNEAYRKQAGLTQLQTLVKRSDGSTYTSVCWDTHSQLKDKLGVLRTTYVSNSWASCSFIGGPHGWCSPEGKIFYSDNVGKWPSVDEVLKDWQTIATAFPYLDLNVTLMGGESCESDVVPLVNIRVVNGQATLGPGDDSVHGGRPAADSFLEHFESLMRGEVSELGLPYKWYDDYAHEVRAAIAELGCANAVV